MKKKKFYHHLIVIDSIHIGLENLHLSPEEKQELIDIVEQSVDHTVMDTILSELHPEDKKYFLALVVDDDHSKVWEMLKDKVENAEEKVMKSAQELLKIFHHDIIESHTKHRH